MSTSTSSTAWIGRRAALGAAGDSGSYIELKRLARTIRDTTPKTNNAIQARDRASNYTAYKKVDAMSCGESISTAAANGLAANRYFGDIENSASRAAFDNCLEAAIAADQIIGVAPSRLLPSPPAAWTTPRRPTTAMYIKNQVNNCRVTDPCAVVTAAKEKLRAPSWKLK